MHCPFHQLLPTLLLCSSHRISYLLNFLILFIYLFLSSRSSEVLLPPPLLWFHSPFLRLNSFQLTVLQFFSPYFLISTSLALLFLSISLSLFSHHLSLSFTISLLALCLPHLSFTASLSLLLITITLIRLVTSFYPF